MATSDLIKAIQDHRKSKVIVYYTCDKARIAPDAVLPIYKLLAKETQNSKVERADLFLNTPGGDVSVPWRIASTFRELSNEFSVLIPYKATSAGTMIALGADKIFMSKKAELGPIDPSLVKPVAPAPQEISIEDVSSYVSFLRNRANITDQAALSQVIGQLASSVGPLTLGTVQRLHSHIRLVARKLLTSRSVKLEEDRIGTIIDALTEKMYSHGHAIGRREARELDLPIQESDDKLEDLLWQLYSEYEALTERGATLEPQEELLNSGQEEVTIKDYPLAVIESETGRYVFRISQRFRWQRQIPPNPAISLNMPIQIPGMVPNQIPPQLQQLLQQLTMELGKVIPGLVQEQIVKQSPIIGIEQLQYGGRWREEPSNTQGAKK